VATALYRRYRPESFAEVIGQDHVTTPLRRALRAGRVGHAYLFSGPRGCGKTTSARILARCLNCAEGPTDTPCGTCDSCRDLARGGAGSLDVVEIDAASHGGVDDARELRERATFAPVRDRYKVFIIDEAHMVTSAGFNALLKLVEEPPDHVKFVFATTEPDKVIGTIRSRTHHYPFRLIPPQVLGPYLEEVCAAENVAVGEGVMPLVVRAGGGSARDSMSVLDQLMAGSDEHGLDFPTAIALLGFTDTALLDQAVTAVAERDAASLYGAVEHVLATGHEPRRFVEDLLERMRDLIVLAAVPDKGADLLPQVPADELERMAAQAGLFSPADLSLCGDLVHETLSTMSGATSPRLHLELLAARLVLRNERAALAGEGSGAPAGERPTGGAPVGRAPAAGGGAQAGGSAPTGGAAAAREQARRIAQEKVEAARQARSGRPADAAPAGAGQTGAGQAGAAPAAPQQAPAPQRPAATGAWGEAAAPAQHAPETQAAPAPQTATAQQSATAQHGDRAQQAAPSHQTPPAQPAGGAPSAPQSAPAGGGGLDPEAVRGHWSAILDELQQIRRPSWALISQNGHVHGVQGTTLLIGFRTEGLVNAFHRGTAAENLADAVRRIMHVEISVDAVVGEDPGPGGGSAGGGSGGSSGPGGYAGGGQPGSGPTGGGQPSGGQPGSGSAGYGPSGSGPGGGGSAAGGPVSGGGRASAPQGAGPVAWGDAAAPASAAAPAPSAHAPSAPSASAPSASAAPTGAVPWGASVGSAADTPASAASAAPAPAAWAPASAAQEAAPSAASAVDAPSSVGQRASERAMQAAARAAQARDSAPMHDQYDDFPPEPDDPYPPDPRDDYRPAPRDVAQHSASQAAPDRQSAPSQSAPAQAAPAQSAPAGPGSPAASASAAPASEPTGETPVVEDEGRDSLPPEEPRTFGQAALRRAIAEGRVVHSRPAPHAGASGSAGAGNAGLSSEKTPGAPADSYGSAHPGPAWGDAAGSAPSASAPSASAPSASVTSDSAAPAPSAASAPQSASSASSAPAASWGAAAAPGGAASIAPAPSAAPAAQAPSAQAAPPAPATHAPSAQAQSAPRSGIALAREAAQASRGAAQRIRGPRGSAASATEADVDPTGGARRDDEDAVVATRNGREVIEKLLGGKVLEVIDETRHT